MLDGRAIDADVPVGTENARVHGRLVSVPTLKGDGVFLTNLPPRIGPRQVADRSCVRWEVERSILLDKSINRLDAIDAEQPCTLETLLQASRIASTIAALLAQTHYVPTHPEPPGAPRTEAPLPPGAWPGSSPSRVRPCPGHGAGFRADRRRGDAPLENDRGVAYA